ncbi:hypothetical protein BW1_040_00500 [Bacillus mycoides NBRC 101238 = DSM 11821]|nr:hypothetical protein BW1_040_00500 [Bacillus mycoides NBRC 101238 = DSM 11821]
MPKLGKGNMYLNIFCLNVVFRIIILHTFSNKKTLNLTVYTDISPYFFIFLYFSSVFVKN